MCELLVSEITGSVLDYPVSHKHYLFVSPPTNLLNIMVYTNISNEITGIYWPHTKAFITTSPLSHRPPIAFKILSNAVIRFF